MNSKKARAIFTNDGECDDMNSFVHLLLYANDIDIEGLVASSSIFHYAGDPEQGIEPKRWADPKWMLEDIDAYERVYPNLVAHDADYPTPEYLRSVTCVGNVRAIGDMSEDTEGSELIRRAIFADDERPLWLLAGGGTNTIGRALKRIELDHKGTDRWEEVYRTVCEKAIIFMIITQDDTYRDYISQAWPDLRMLHCTSIRGIAFMYDETVIPRRDLGMFEGSWVKPNLLDKGALLERYHTWGDGHVYPGEEDRSQFGSNLALMDGSWWGKQPRNRYDMISEGDSPSFLHLIDKGLRTLEDPSFGGWGGRFRRNADNEFNRDADYWECAVDEPAGPTTGEALQLTRWIGDWMNDFASRATWCVTPDEKSVNHAPEVSVEEGVDVVAAPGQEVTLHAVATDPDGDEVRVTWTRYADADTYAGEVALDASRSRDGATVHLTVPDDARAGDTIHLIVRASDEPSRTPYMVNYRRVIITVGA